MQDVVLTGADADLTALPVHLGHGADGGPYISSSIDFVVDPKTGMDQCGRAPADAARPPGSRHRSRLAERPARDLRGERRRRQAAAGELRGRRAPDRPSCRRDAAAGRRARPGRLAARCPAAGGQVRHQRHPRAGRCRMGAGGLSRRARARGARGPLRRVPRLLRRAQAQSGLPSHRDHAPPRRAVPDLDHRRLFARAAPIPRCSTRCAPRS